MPFKRALPLHLQNHIKRLVRGFPDTSLSKIFQCKYIYQHLLFWACKTINLTIFESGEMQSSTGSAKGLAPCLIGEFSALPAMRLGKFPNKPTVFSP